MLQIAVIARAEPEPDIIRNRPIVQEFVGIENPIPVLLRPDRRAVRPDKEHLEDIEP